MLRSLVESLAFQPPTPATYTDSLEDMVWLDAGPGAGQGRRGNWTVTAEVASWAPGAYTIVFSHGNGEDLGMARPLLDMLATALQVNAVGYDYPGYGPRRDPRILPSEHGAYAALTAVLAWLERELQIPRSRVVLYGHSLGSGPTVHLAAARGPPAAVVLMSAFRSAARVARYDLGPLDWLAGDIFINQAKVGALRCPVLLVHGRHDDIVPAEHGQDLAARCRPAAPLILLDCGHNDVLALYADVFLAEVAQLLDRITKAPSPSATSAAQG